MNNKEYRRDFRINKVPKYYNRNLHVLFNFGTLIALTSFFYMQSGIWGLSNFLVFSLTMVLGSLVVYCIHRFPLHRRYPIIEKETYRIHSGFHHVFYTDEHLIYEIPDDFYILFFPPQVVLGFALVPLPLAYFVLSPFVEPSLLFTFLGTSSLYFLLYEVVHLACHLPEHHTVLKLPFVKFLWEHHKLHHNPKYMHKKNFNIVLPIFDYVFGTKHKDVPKMEYSSSN